MRKVLLTAVAISCLGAAPALAADRPIYKAPPAYEPVFSWSGCYVGAQIGYGWGSSRHSFSNGAPTDKSDPNGVLGGGHLGCNYQVANWVVGVEGDLEAADLNGSFSNVTGATSVGSARVRWDGSVRARLGVAFDRSLLYVTGGWALARYNFGGGPFPPPPCCGFSSTVDGWTLGVGWEYAFTNNWTGRIEYRHADFGRVSGGLPPTFPGVIMTVRNSLDVVRAGLTYKF